jgi:hypothetical protein
MTDRVFEDARSIEVSGGGRSVEVYVFETADVMITVTEDAGYDSQHASFTLTDEEATALKLFLIKQGY